mmetsp:Transcript_27668/g.51903  ORF Transcript_27668/g.51903 Transcript_27668/m.51903 type:complete len:220 (-) Transcript_27668:694-1353(-)
MAIVGQGAVDSCLVKLVLLALVFAPNIQGGRATKLGRNIAMSIGHVKLFQQLELLLPAGSMGVPDESTVGEDGFSLITQGAVMARGLELVLVALSLYPLSKLLVGSVRMRNKHVSVMGAEGQQFIEAVVPLSRLVLASALRTLGCLVVTGGGRFPLQSRQAGFLLRCHGNIVRAADHGNLGQESIEFVDGSRLLFESSVNVLAFVHFVPVKRSEKGLRR